MVIAVDVEEALSAPPSPEKKEEKAKKEEEEPKETPPPARRGRPPGSKDKAPRKRPARAVSPEVLEAPPPRPVTRRSSAPKSAPRRRVRIVEEESDYSSAEDVPEPPSPRTRRHQEWTAYRQQQADTHQANVNRYASMFDRMLA